MNHKVFQPHLSAEKQDLGTTFIESDVIKSAGRVVNEPEYLSAASTGKPVIAFRIDVQNPTPNSRGMWQSHGESFLVVANAFDFERVKNVQAGQPVYIEGRYRIYSWNDDKQLKNYSVQFEATKIQPLVKEKERAPEKDQERDLS